MRSGSVARVRQAPMDGDATTSFGQRRQPGTDLKRHRPQPQRVSTRPHRARWACGFPWARSYGTLH